MLYGCIACFLALVLSVPAMAQQSEDLNFASRLEQFQNIRRMLPSYLNGIGLRMLEERKRRVERLATIEDLYKRRAYLREQMLKDLGGFPDRTPLNARVVGVVERSEPASLLRACKPLSTERWASALPSDPLSLGP
ncbi:MAG: hypothetical protein DMG49_17070 [Acidobacteria bacterium]|nr:MAG: hypothetical protein DMG49_17070 [Acidobacteriota bacterium]